MFTADEVFTTARARRIILESMEKASDILLKESSVEALDNRLDWFERYSVIMHRFSEAMKNCEDSGGTR